MSDSTATAESSSDSNDGSNLAHIVDEVRDGVDGENVTVGEVLDAIDNRGFGPLLLIPAIISISPVGGIPGMSLITGLLIFLIAFQMIFHGDHPWIPSRLEKFEFSRERFQNGIDRARPWVRWTDRWVSERLTLFSTGPMHYVLASLMMLLSLTYIPLALVPMGVFLPGLANTFFAIGITARDGVIVIFGLIASAAAVYGVIAFWPW